jgi:hypothetical protein
VGEDHAGERWGELERELGVRMVLEECMVWFGCWLAGTSTTSVDVLSS